MTAWTLSSVRGHVPRIALLFILLGCLSLALLPSVVSAQTVSPQIVEFDPSADHNTSVSGVAVVDGYELRFYSLGGTQPLHVIELGKPAPEADGKIRFNFASLLGAWPVGGVVYEARVAAVGPGGSTASAISNQFVFPVTPPPPCSYAFSSTAGSGGAGASTGTVNVVAGAGCAWTATSDAGWLTITSGGSGSGNGSIGYSVAANSNASQRAGRLSVGSATFTFTQAAAACGYSFSPTSRTVGTSATTGSVSCHVAQRLRLDCVQLGNLAQHYERRDWIRTRDNQLQRRGQHRIVRPPGDADGRDDDVYADAEWVVHVCGVASDFERRHCGDDRYRGSDGRKRLLVDGGKLGHVALDYWRRERERRRRRELQRLSQQFDVVADRNDYSRHGDLQPDAGWRLRLLALPHHADRRKRHNDRERRRHGRKHVLLVGVELGVVADGDERRQRSRERHRELQCRCEHGVHRTLRHPDCGVGHLHADAERVVHIHRDSDESRLQSADRNRQRDGDRGQRMRVDGHTLGVVDHDHQRSQRNRERHRALPRLGERRFIVTDRHADGSGATRDHHAVRRHGAQRASRPAHRDRAVDRLLVRPLAKDVQARHSPARGGPAATSSSACGRKNTKSNAPKIQYSRA